MRPFRKKVAMLRDARLAARQRAREAHFVFIHINKTGGSSIEKALELPFEHKTAVEKIREIGREVWNEKFTFSVVRNPWDKVVSHYHYRMQRNQTGLRDAGTDFSTWVDLAYGQQSPSYYDNPKMFMPQSDWLTDDDGVLLVDRVCRFENLQDDFASICETLEINAELPHVKASVHDDYRTYYTDNAKEVVAEWFKKDIDRFDYTF